MKKIVIGLFLLPQILCAQLSKKDSTWAPLKFLIGEGEPGKGNYERTYEFVLNKNFIEVKNRSSYPPTDKQPNGEVHEDNGYISYDKLRKTFILRQFHIEGFVNQYKLDNISADGKTIVFISEAIENIAAGWRARETYTLTSPDEFTETFELAAPKGQFEVYTKTQFRRSSK